MLNILQSVFKIAGKALEAGKKAIPKIAEKATIAGQKLNNAKKVIEKKIDNEHSARLAEKQNTQNNNYNNLSKAVDKDIDKYEKELAKLKPSFLEKASMAYEEKKKDTLKKIDNKPLGHNFLLLNKNIANAFGQVFEGNLRVIKRAGLEGTRMPELAKGVQDKYNSYLRKSEKTRDKRKKKLALLERQYQEDLSLQRQIRQSSINTYLKGQEAVDAQRREIENQYNKTVGFAEQKYQIQVQNDPDNQAVYRLEKENTIQEAESEKNKGMLSQNILNSMSQNIMDVGEAVSAQTNILARNNTNEEEIDDITDQLDEIATIEIEGQNVTQTRLAIYSASLDENQAFMNENLTKLYDSEAIDANRNQAIFASMREGQDHIINKVEIVSNKADEIAIGQEENQKKTQESLNNLAENQNSTAKIVATSGNTTREVIHNATSGKQDLEITFNQNKTKEEENEFEGKSAWVFSLVSGVIGSFVGFLTNPQQLMLSAAEGFGGWVGNIMMVAHAILSNIGVLLSKVPGLRFATGFMRNIVPSISQLLFGMSTPDLTIAPPLDSEEERLETAKRDILISTMKLTLADIKYAIDKVMLWIQKIYFQIRYWFNILPFLADKTKSETALENISKIDSDLQKLDADRKNYIRSIDDSVAESLAVINKYEPYTTSNPVTATEPIMANAPVREDNDINNEVKTILKENGNNSVAQTQYQLSPANNNVVNTNIISYATSTNASFSEDIPQPQANGNV